MLAYCYRCGDMKSAKGERWFKTKEMTIVLIAPCPTCKSPLTRAIQK